MNIFIKDLDKLVAWHRSCVHQQRWPAAASLWRAMVSLLVSPVIGDPDNTGLQWWWFQCDPTMYCRVINES